jgi:hypothetical protein
MKQLNIDRLVFTVNTRKGPIQVELRLLLNEAGTAPEYVFPVEMGLESGEGRIELAGDLGLSPPFFQGRLTWRGLRMPPFLLLAVPDVVPWLTSSQAEGDLDVTFRSVQAAGEPAAFTTSGTSVLSNVVFKDPESGELALECDRLSIELRRGFYPLEASAESPIQLDIAKLLFEGPKITYTNPPDALNRLLAAFGAGEAEPEASDATSSADPAPPQDPGGVAPEISVDTLTIENGQVRYSDRTVTPTHETHIDDLGARIDGVTTAPNLGAKSIAIDGLIHDTGIFKLRGALPNGDGELKVDFKRIKLVPFDPFARAAGWRVDSGTTTLNSVIKSRGGTYATRNELVLHDLDVTPDDGGGFSATFGMSLDLALALLRDPSGDIALSMPVDVGKDGMSLGIGSLIWRALRDAIVGALTSPIKLMGALISSDGGPASFDPIGFDAGSAAPNEQAKQRLVSLTELLSTRPGLRLSLEGQWSDEDRPVLALAILREKALSGESFPEIEDGSLLARRRVVAALRDRAVGDEGLLDPEDEQRLQQYIEAQEVSADRLRAIADSRAEGARAVLLDADVAVDSVTIEPSSSADHPGVSLALQPKVVRGGDEVEGEAN